MPKWLEVRNQKRPVEENKMQPGSRADQTRVDPRIVAQQLGVDISRVTGTGEGGEVTSKDVRAHAQKTKETNQKTPPISGVRRTTSSPKPVQSGRLPEEIKREGEGEGNTKDED